MGGKYEISWYQGARIRICSIDKVDYDRVSAQIGAEAPDREFSLMVPTDVRSREKRFARARIRSLFLHVYGCFRRGVERLRL